MKKILVITAVLISTPFFMNAGKDKNKKKASQYEAERPEYPEWWKDGYSPNQPAEYTRRLSPSEVCSVNVQCKHCDCINTIIYPCNDSNPAPVPFPCQECGLAMAPVRTERPFESQATWYFSDSRVVRK